MDSLHTIWQYKDHEIEKYRLTHLLFANIGSMGYGTQEETEDNFIRTCAKMKAIADEEWDTSYNKEIVSTFGDNHKWLPFIS